MDIIQTALARGQKALSEHQAKQVLKYYDIPVTREILTRNITEAVAAATKIGYPVALKACSPDLMHKSESGVIRLNLKDDMDVEAAYAQILKQTRVELSGILVQEMVSGPRELVAGLIREPQFGPCVMLGLGGVMTEILSDTVFRVAPFDAAEADDMLTQLRANAVFDTFRGQQPVNREKLRHTLMAIGRMGLEHPEISEIDINPMMIQSDGQIVAVDALIVLNGSRVKEEGGL